MICLFIHFSTVTKNHSSDVHLCDFFRFSLRIRCHFLSQQIFTKNSLVSTKISQNKTISLQINGLRKTESVIHAYKKVCRYRYRLMVYVPDCKWTTTAINCDSDHLTICHCPLISHTFLQFSARIHPILIP